MVGAVSNAGTRGALGVAESAVGSTEMDDGRGDGLVGSRARNASLMGLQFKEQRREHLISGFTDRFRFTPRQGQVFRLWLEGLAAKDIAAELSLSNGTLRRYSRGIYQKCGVRSERETLALFVRSMLGVE